MAATTPFGALASSQRGPDTLGSQHSELSLETLRIASTLLRSAPELSSLKVASRNGRDFSGWEIAHGAVKRRPPISLDTVVPRTGGYAYGVGVWDSSIVQGPFSVAPCPP
jgi:hypothetical protein